MKIGDVLLSVESKEVLKEAKVTLKDSEALVIEKLKELGITHQEFRLLKSNSDQKVSSN